MPGYRIRWNPALVGALPILLTGCTVVTTAGEALGPPMEELSRLATLSWGWLLPAFWLWNELRQDRAETVSRSASGWSAQGEYVQATVSVPTGRTIPGDPRKARLVAWTWLMVFPFGLAYWPTWQAESRRFTGYQNLDLFLVKAGIPLAVLGLAYLMSRWLTTGTSAPVRWLARGWMAVVLLGTLNFVGWYGYVGVLWLLDRPPGSAVLETGTANRSAPSQSKAEPLSRAMQKVLPIRPALPTYAEVRRSLVGLGASITMDNPRDPDGIGVIVTRGTAGYRAAGLTEVQYGFWDGVLVTVFIIRRVPPPGTAQLRERYEALSRHYRLRHYGPGRADFSGAGVEVHLALRDNHLHEFYQLLRVPMLRIEPPSP